MILQISVILKDFNVRVSWDALADAVKAQLGASDVFAEKLGNFQCRLYLPDGGGEQLPDRVRDILAGLASGGQSEDGHPSGSRFVVTVKDLSPEDVKNLKPDVVHVLADRPAFRQSIDLSAANAAPAEKPAPVQPAAEQTAAPTERTPAPQAPAEEQPPAEERLGALTGQLRAVTDQLLGKVRGQHHAVTELVSGVFESELFARDDADRRGPLALTARLGRRDRKGRLDLRDLPDRKDLRDLLDPLDLRGLPDPPDLRGLPDPPDLRDLRDRSVR